MPYISKYARKSLDDGRGVPEHPGELNYLFTKIALEYFKRNRNYQGINDIIGALEGAKLEFYRRYAAPYEDIKLAENGDV